MNNSNKKKVVILGAGITGLTAAYTLSREGFDTAVVERNHFPGGLAASFIHDGHPLDYGPHNFHTHMAWILGFLENELGADLKKMPSRPAKIFFNGKIVDYPISIFNSLRSVNLLVSLRCFVDFLRARIRIKLTNDLSDESFEDWVENRFGRYLYDVYFGSYVEKVWGMSGRELDAVIAKKRIPEPSLMTLILRALTGIQFGKRHSEDPHVTGSYYPKKGGIGSIADQFVRGIASHGGRISLDSAVQEISVGNNAGYIRYSVNGEPVKEEFDYLINTIPLTGFFSYLKAGAVQRPLPDTSFFVYRGIIFLYLTLSRSKLTDHPWIYFNERNNNDLIFNRLYEVSNFTSVGMPEKNGMLCLEITCYKDDHIWKKTDEELFESCSRFLIKNKFLDKSDVKGYFTKRIAEVYPVFKKGYLAHLHAALDYLAGAGNVFTIGRQGLFSYANMDHCIDMGLKMGALVDGGKLNINRFSEVYKEYLQ